MRLMPWGLILLTMPAVLTVPPAAAEIRIPGGTVDVSPREAPQGGLLFITVQVPSGQQVEARWQNEPVPLYRHGAEWRGVLGITPDTRAGEHQVRIRDQGGATLALVPVKVTPVRFAVQHLKMARSTARLYNAPGSQQEDAEVSAAIRERSDERFWGGPWRLPAQGRTSTPFGVRRLRNGRPVGRHKGLDIAAPTGTPIYAPAAARVVLSKNYKKYGHTLVLDHGQGVTSLYIHMSSRAVQAGEQVTRGQLIGRIGATGVATGPHLHWSTYVFGSAVEPRSWIALSRSGAPAWAAGKSR